MLIATGIMAIGLVMVAMVFPVGVKLTAMTTERTIGAIAADEAFAKVQLYGLRDFDMWPAGVDPNTECLDFQYVNNVADMPTTWDDFQYPSSVALTAEDRNYHWSALCRRVGAKDVQVTVFVNRRINAAAFYRTWNPTGGAYGPNEHWPKPVPVNIQYNASNPKLLVIAAGPGSLAIADSKYFFDDGYTIVDNHSGRIYRVLEVDNVNGILKLQENWFDNGLATETVWVVPPAVSSSRYPCVGVYQKVIRFDEIN